MHHVVSNTVIDIAESLHTAESRCYTTVFRATDDFALQPIACGVFHDRFQRDEPGWYFVARVGRMRLAGAQAHTVRPHDQVSASRFVTQVTNFHGDKMNLGIEVEKMITEAGEVVTALGASTVDQCSGLVSMTASAAHAQRPFAQDVFTWPSAAPQLIGGRCPSCSTVPSYAAILSSLRPGRDGAPPAASPGELM